MFNLLIFIFIYFQKLINLCNCNVYDKHLYDQIHFLHTLCALLNNQQNTAIMFFFFVIYLN